MKCETCLLYVNGVECKEECTEQYDPPSIWKIVDESDPFKDECLMCGRIRDEDVHDNCMPY